MQGRLAPLGIELDCLLAEEPIDVGMTSVGVGAARDHEGLDPGGRVPEGSAGALDDALVRFLGISLEEGRPLEGPQPGPDPDRPEIVDHGLGDVGEDDVAKVFASVEAVGISGFGQQLAGSRRIVSNNWWLPVELEAAGDDAPDEPREPQELGLVHGRAIDSVVDGQPYPSVVKG